RAGLSVGWPAEPALLSDPAGHLHRPEPHRLPARSETQLPRPSDRAYLGWAERAQESPHAALSHRAVGLAADRTPARLGSRNQARRTALGHPEGRLIDQPLRRRPCPSADPGACGLAPDPEPACARSWFLHHAGLAF